MAKARAVTVANGDSNNQALEIRGVYTARNRRVKPTQLHP